MAKKNKKSSNKATKPQNEGKQPEAKLIDNTDQREPEPVAVDQHISDKERAVDIDNRSSEKTEEDIGTGSSQELADESLQSVVERQKKEIEKLNNQVAQLELGPSDKERSDSDDLEELREQLEQSEQAREEAEQDYENLREKVSHIKATLGERLKADAAELAECKDQNAQLQETIDTLQREVITANKETDKLSHELSNVRQQFQKSLDAWEKEKTSLTSQMRKDGEDAEKYKSMYRDLEVAILEERAQKENFNSKLSELQDQVSNQTAYAEEFRKERDLLRRQLDEANTKLEHNSTEFETKAGKLEREHAKTNESLQNLQKEHEGLSIKLSESQKEVERLLPMEKEVKEKSLLIGKLRHEAVILNEHLTKALRMIKKDAEGETVDKQLISNLIISFVTIPRGDTKKFEVLQLISNFLGWEEEQKVQAGLSRGSNGPLNTKSGVSTPKRSHSNNSLASYQDSEGATTSGGFMGLFAEFLERESSKK